ncbi:unnamed protein product, partial [Ectocarpus sp. 12 AP-2014]
PLASASERDIVRRGGGPSGTSANNKLCVCRQVYSLSLSGENMESMEEDGSNTMTAGVPSGHLEGELENVCRELALVDAKVAELLDTQTALQTRRDQLSTEIQARQKRRVLPQRDWGGDDFEWSEEMGGLLRGTFGLSSWRTNQKEIVNATLSGRDAFVVMRTGGGKSLCYQLPALLKGGITVGAARYPHTTGWVMTPHGVIGTLLFFCVQVFLAVFFGPGGGGVGAIALVLACVVSVPICF